MADNGVAWRLEVNSPGWLEVVDKLPTDGNLYVLYRPMAGLWIRCSVASPPLYGYISWNIGLPEHRKFAGSC